MFRYDARGMGAAELLRLALVHPFIFSIVFFLINHGAGKWALILTRRVI